MKTNKVQEMNALARQYVTQRLEYLRQELRENSISYDELVELTELAVYIDPSDVELLEAAGVSESDRRKK